MVIGAVHNWLQWTARVASLPSEESRCRSSSMGPTSGAIPVFPGTALDTAMGDQMQILKWTGSVLAAVVLALVLLVAFARFGDGPIAIVPGGPLEAGELYSGVEPDWTFARDYPEMEFQLVEPPVSRTIWLQVVDGKLYAVSGYMNSTIGTLWKQWPLQAVKDPRAVIRIDGKRYERTIVRLGPDHPALEAIASETRRKYGAALRPEMAATGDAWFYAFEPRAR